MASARDMICGVRRFFVDFWVELFSTALGAGIVWAAFEFPKLTLPALVVIAAAVFFLYPKPKTGRQLRRERRQAERERRSKQSAGSSA